MTSNYVAIYIPGPRYMDVKGFYTQEAAWRYIEARLCRMCKRCLEAGYMTINEGTKDEDIVDIIHIHDTMCGKDWDTIPQSTYDLCNPKPVEDIDKL